MERYKITKMEHDITSAEVEEMKDFGGLLKAYQKSILRKKFLFSLLPMSIIIGSVFYFYLPATISLPSADLQMPPKMEEAKNTMNDSNNSSRHTDSIVVTSKANKKLLRKKKGNIKKEKVREKNHPFSFVKTAPDYGLDSLINYLHIELSKKDLPQINGNVLIAFTIDATGRPSAVKIMQGISRQVDVEIVHLIKNMPTWQPAQMDGKPVASTTTLPIKIVINSTNEEN